MSTASALLLTMALAANGETLLLEFTAEWCGPCRVMEPTVARLVSSGYPVRKIDVDRDARTASRYAIQGVPCFVMLVDGQEVERVTGAVSHDRLVQMYQQARFRAPRAPATAMPSLAAGGATVRAQSPDGALEARGQLGNLPPLNGAPQPLVAPPRNHAAAANGVDPVAVRAAYQATVRLRVEDPQGHGYGTGTIIDVHGKEALVVTCGHLFRDSKGKGTIQADLFNEGQVRTVPGQLISYDLERDIALVSITPGQPVTPARVAASGEGLERGVAVFSIGCDKGQPPSVRKSHVTAIDRYLGPPNIEVAGQPVDGRSGGGLFAADGRLIGICNAADPADNEGIYASLPTIHWELDRIGQRRIYESRGPALLAQGSSAPTRATPPAMPDRMVLPAVASQPQTVTPAGGNDLNSDTEVICIIRSRRDPQGQQRLLVLDRPSADLLARLRLESQAGTPAASIARQPTAPSRRGLEPVIRAQSADR